MLKILKKQFFERSVQKVAEELLGKYIVRKIGDNIKAYMITETEAYDGEKDLACHSSKGRTKRCEVMYGEAGHFYIYLVYGMHYMLNIVTGPKDYPAAVLVRSVKEIQGPGRVTKILNIDKNLNGKSAIIKNELWFEDRGLIVKKKNISKTPRIGVDYAGPIWSKKLWRYVLKDE